MDLKKKVYETIKEKKLLESKRYDVVLGFSGGPDSLALFNVLVELSLDYVKSNGKYGYDMYIHPVHINHNLRGEDSDMDEKFVVDFSKDMASKYPDIVRDATVYSVDIEGYSKAMKLSTEETGRKIRYMKFLEAGRELSDPVIMVAQNANDRAETILFRLLRGTSIKGLEGIPYERYEDELRVVRPLLDCTREEIETYLKEKDLNPRIDKTNLEEMYSRNKIRLDLIPKLKEYNPNIIETLNRFSDSLLPINEYLDKEADSYIKSINGNSIRVKELKEIPKVIRYEIYKKMLSNIGMKEDITKVHLDEIDKMVGPTNHKVTIVELANNYRVSKEEGKFTFYLSDLPTA